MANESSIEKFFGVLRESRREVFLECEILAHEHHGGEGWKGVCGWR